jgi:hypothetical protein
VPGVTQQYDAILQAMGRSLGSAPEPGQLFHVSGPYAGGWRVVDVWESQEAFDRLARGQLLAVMATAGVEVSGTPQVLEVYNMER